MNLRLIFLEIVRDRAVQAGTGSSTVSLAGAAGMSGDPLGWAATFIGHAQPWIVFFAAIFGGLCSAATFILICIKIHRLLKQPKALE